MPTYNRLTDRALATGVTLNDLIHIVITGDTSQNAAGSSYKAKVSQLVALISGSTGSAGTSGTSGANGSSGSSGSSGLNGSSGINGTSGSSGVSGTSGTSGGGSGAFLPLSGGTVTGNTYFGTTSGITIDQANSRIGIGTSNPTNPIQAFVGNTVLNYSSSAGGVLDISGSTNLPRMSATIAASGGNPLASMNIGMRAWTDATYPGYGKVGDGHLYASNEANGLNIINRQGTGTEDYIRFYAGQDANGTIPDIHIAGTGSTRGFVGIGTENPDTLLHVSGNTKISGTLSATTLDVNGSIYQRTGELLITSTGGVNKEGPFIASSGGDELSSDRKIQLGISDNSTVPVGINMFVTNNTFPPSYMNFRVNNADLVTMSGSSVVINGLIYTSGITATTISATTYSGNSNTISGTKGTVVVNGSTGTAFLTFSGSNTIGGTGYTDFIRVTNTASGAVTPTKSFRLNNIGEIEIINSAYNSNIFTLGDTGNLTVSGRMKSSVNYSQTGGGTKVTLGASVTPQTILSTSITTYGNPVMVCAYGDAENTGAGYWSTLQLYRDSTAIGAIVHTEGSAASENTPFAFTYIDNPTAGTYTYYLKANQVSGGNINFGESTAPILNVREL